MSIKYRKFGIVDNETEISEAVRRELLLDSSCVRIQSPEDLEKTPADVLLVLGGDGFMLHTMHRFFNANLPFYGINCGTLGFLLNDVVSVDDLSEVVNNAEEKGINPIRSEIIDLGGNITVEYAINEISLLRSTHQTAHIRIKTDGAVRLENLVADGIILSTPAGSTSYNFSLRGPIIPIGSELVAMTPISPFRPRFWSGALLPYDTEVEFEVLDANIRKVNATADYEEVVDIASVKAHIDRSCSLRILFDSKRPISDRIIGEQFFEG